VSPIGPKVFIPGPEWWPPKKGNNFGQKKSTLTGQKKSKKVKKLSGQR
jgi:hypothetical protein